MVLFDKTSEYEASLSLWFMENFPDLRFDKCFLESKFILHVEICQLCLFSIFCRCLLAQQVMQKMIYDILPPSIRPPVVQYVPAKSLPADVMAKTMKSIFTKGWLDLVNLHTLEALLNLCGSDWFSERLIKVRKNLIETKYLYSLPEDYILD